MIKEKKPCILILGFAGSGKTTLVQRLLSFTQENFEKPSYSINLDPAVYKIPYKPNIDIRSTINYSETMERYGLGPNGAILTSLNLYSMQFDKVIKLIKKRNKEISYTIIDTPGQIETFTWSASGQIITETLGASFPTIIIFVIDTERASNPSSFMANMLYACSIMYKTRLPFLIAFTKIDICSPIKLKEWINDWDKLDSDLDEYVSDTGLSRSLSLVLEEFYKSIETVTISSITGEGIEEFFKKINKLVLEYNETYLKEIKKLKLERKKQLKLKKISTFSEIERDLEDYSNLEYLQREEIGPNLQPSIEKVINLLKEEQDEEEEN